MIIASESGISRSFCWCPFALSPRFIPKAPATSISSPMNNIFSPNCSASVAMAFCMDLLNVHEFGASENLIPYSPDLRIASGTSPSRSILFICCSWLVASNSEVTPLTTEFPSGHSISSNSLLARSITSSSSFSIRFSICSPTPDLISNSLWFGSGSFSDQYRSKSRST